MDAKTVSYPRGLESFRGGWRWRRTVKKETCTRTLKVESEQEAVEQAILLNARLKAGTLPMGQSERVPLARFMREFLAGKATTPKVILRLGPVLRGARRPCGRVGYTCQQQAGLNKL
jgi:hypothetical protein